MFTLFKGSMDMCGCGQSNAMEPDVIVNVTSGVPVARASARYPYFVLFLVAIIVGMMMAEKA